MELLLTTQGLLYNGPALILLAYLILSRPLTGAVVALLAAVRVFGPPFGVGQWVPFSVHMTLVGATAASYRQARPISSSILLVGSLLIFLLTTYFYLLVWREPVPWALGALVGVGVRALALFLRFAGTLLETTE